jgi:hypothetical protein
MLIISGTFFGIGQMRLPINNFGRIILMVFILFCLIIRTAYLGVLFEMITTDMRKNSPNTMEQLLAQNYTIYFRYYDIKLGVNLFHF